MTTRFIRNCFLGLATLGLATAPGYAQGKGQGKGKGRQKHQEEDSYTKYRFGVHERDLIVQYYSGGGSNLPPGLAKRGGNLPPGLQKQLERNGTLPPGLQKRVQPFPVELEQRLPPLPPDYRRGTIGAHVVIFNRRTQVIVDVLKDVVR